MTIVKHFKDFTNSNTSVLYKYLTLPRIISYANIP